jgi:hypothetical protein
MVKSEIDPATRAEGLVRSIFAEAADEGRKEVLRRAQIRLGADGAIGVATFSSLQRELTLKGFQRKESRELVREVIAGLGQGAYNRIFTEPPHIIEESTQAGVGKLFYRNDLSPKEAIKRYAIYDEILQDEIKLRKESAEKQSKGQSEVAQSISIPQTNILEIFAPYEQADVSKRTVALKLDTPQGIVVDAINYEQRHFRDPTGSVLHRTDVKWILKKGLNPEELTGLLHRVRAGVVETTEQIEEFASEASKGILTLAGSIFDSNPNRPHLILAYSQRPLAPFLAAAIANSNENTNFTLRINIPLPYEDLPASFPSELMLRWGSRFDKNVLTKFTESLGEDSDPLGDRMLELLVQENADLLIEDLRNKNAATFNGNHLHFDEVKTKYAMHRLPDEILLRAMLADTIGEIFPMAYVFEDMRRDVGFAALKKLAEQFSAQEIQGILVTPLNVDIVDLRTRIAELERQRQQKDQEFKAASKKYKKALLPVRNQIVKERDDLIAQQKAYKSVRTNVTEALDQKMESGKEIKEAFLYVSPSGWEKGTVPHAKIITATEKLASLVQDELLGENEHPKLPISISKQ